MTTAAPFSRTAIVDEIARTNIASVDRQYGKSFGNSNSTLQKSFFDNCDFDFIDFGFTQ